MARGQLRIYLGAAPGVGKTYAMLNEGWRRKERGTDVVVGFVEAHNRPLTAAQVRDLEVVARRRLAYRGAMFEEMDLDAVLERKPKVALVDELAHTNVPGVRHAKRWEDVEDLLEAGIDVISTVNIQHLESVNDVVERITGVRQRETIPDAIVRAADQIELVDMSPEALRRRMAHGNIYAPEKVDAALGNYFRVGNLAALREIALMWVADRVDEALQSYRSAHGIERSWETRERVVVALTGAPSGEQLVRRAARMAQRSRGELIGVHVTTDEGLAGPPEELLAHHRQLLTDLGGRYHEVVGTDAATALVQFAVAENASQLVLGSSRRSRLAELLRGSVINRVIHESGAIDVHVISTGEPQAPTTISGLLPTWRRVPHLSRRRRASGWLLALIGLPALTVLLTHTRSTLNLPAVMLLYLVLVVVVAGVGGIGPAVVTAAASSLTVNYWFTEPLYTFTIGAVANLVALIVFLAVAVLVSALVTQLSRRSVEAARARAEAEALADLAGGMLGDADPLGGVLLHLRTTFGLDAVAVLRASGERGWVVEAEVGAPVPASPEGHDTLELGDGDLLVLVGKRLPSGDRRLLQAFAAQLSSALEQRRLRAEAAEAQALAEADELRTAILRAVSHDLRTPLSSIKATVTSLLQPDVRWSGDEQEEFLRTIDEESDRLNVLVGNLLDMSRLETGSMEVMLQPVGLDEIVPAALASLSGLGPERVRVDVPDTLPWVVADPALLERAVANVVANAVRFSPLDRPVRVEAGAVGPYVDLRVVDRGPGVAPAQRERIFEPFQRLGNTASDTGVGLGLAVARGFVDAMGGELVLDDTPGGGLTTVISLRQAA